MALTDRRSAAVFALRPQGYLLYRDTSNHTMSAIKINPETLEPEGTIIMPGTSQTLLFGLFTKTPWRSSHRLKVTGHIHCRVAFLRRPTFRRAEHHLH